MKSSKIGDLFAIFLLISLILLFIYGTYLICVSETKEREKVSERLYKEGYAAGEIELNPLLSPYTERAHYNIIWKKGYADAIIKKKQKAEYER